MGDKVFKVLGSVLALGAGIAAQRLATQGWKLVMNDEPPANPESPETEMWEAVAWALGSGAVVALARLVATRKWTQYYVKSTGHLPGDPDAVA